MTRVLIGGVGYRWAGDASFGLAVTDALAREAWPRDVEIADLGYGALYVALDLLDRKPPLDRLILIAATVRDRQAGELSVTRWTPAPQSSDELQARVREAGAGVIDLDHLLAIANHFGALPNDVRCIELEPVEGSGRDALSGPAREQLSRACRLARDLALGTIDAASVAPSHGSSAALGSGGTSWR